MEHYVLATSKNKYLAQGNITDAMIELMKIIKDTGSIPEVSFNQKKNETEFRFEGEYCDFSIILYPAIIDID